MFAWLPGAYIRTVSPPAPPRYVPLIMSLIGKTETEERERERPEASHLWMWMELADLVNLSVLVTLQLCNTQFNVNAEISVGRVRFIIR